MVEEANSKLNIMPLSILWTFPDFNIRSTPLLILTLQGLLFGFLLLKRYYGNRHSSDLLLAFILLITCFHRTTYTIGFMDWYDTFRNTKINYFLIPFDLAFAPLLYFYVRSVTISDFKFHKKDYWHFLFFGIYFPFRLGIWLYDRMQTGYHETQNGNIMSHPWMEYFYILFFIFTSIQMILYLAFAFQHYLNYKNKIHHYFSNTYNLELNWLRNFLLVYTFLYLYGTGQVVVDTFFTSLSYIQEWWFHLASAMAIIYVSIMGYFTKTESLSGLSFDPSTVKTASLILPEVSSVAPRKPDTNKRDMEKLIQFMENEKPYLNPELNLIDLSNALGMSRSQVSQLINTGLGKNFNDYINQFRVSAVQEMLRAGRQEELSLLGIAYDCGFNSKATFNRVFKKLTGTSPSAYAKNL